MDRLLMVLLAEDDPLLSGVVAEYLRSFGISVIPVSSIDEARRALATVNVDCVVSDFFLEGGNAKDIAAMTDAPMIVISGYDQCCDPDLHTYAWLAKPFDLGSLERLVHRACAKTA